MMTAHKIQYWLKRLARVVMLLTLLINPAVAGAQDEPPPFWFYLTPAYANNQITYTLEFDNRVDWFPTDLTVQIAVPPGARFVAAKTLPANRIDFDGQYVKFYIPTLVYGLEGNSFTIEITDPTKTIFTTHGIISWGGAYPGSYQIESEPFDITRAPLNWEAPGQSRLQLSAKATVNNNTVTYEVYVQSIERQYRMWDVRLSLLFPPGATVTMIEAPNSFQTGFDETAVYFSTLELTRLTEIGPLIVTLTLPPKTTNAVQSAQLWAVWKNGAKNSVPIDGPAIIYPDTGVEDPTPPAEEMIMLDVSLKQQQLEQQLFFDNIDDAPFANYDLTSVAIRETGPTVNISFNTVAQKDIADPPAWYTLYIDSDCNSNTGELTHYRGAEYRLDYASETGKAFFVDWNDPQQDWNWDQSRDLTAQVENNTATITLPNYLFETARHFCWVAAARTETGLYYPEPPTDWLTNEKFLNITQYSLLNSIVADTGEIPDADESNPAIGKLAIPMRNWQGFYDVYIFSVADQEEIFQIPGARQPNFHPDGNTLLINRQHTLDQPAPIPTGDQRFTYVFKDIGLKENIYEYNLADGSETRVSDNPNDSHPFYAPAGNQFVYGNAVSFLAVDGSPLARLVAPCGILSPHQNETEPCHVQNRMLASVKQENGIWGRYPLWAENNSIIFQGCAAGQNAVTECGVYALNAQSLTSSPGKDTPMQLTREPGDIPSDTKLNLIAFTSQRDGNWEAYLMNLDGSNLINLSNNPAANDGLPVISPNGDQVAFVSDRDGQWAVWLVSTAGGPARKFVNLYGDNPLGNDREWLTERMAWGN